MRREIYWVNFEPASPPEFGKVRPALILSNSDQNIMLDSVVVLPLSSRGVEIWPLRVKCSVSLKKDTVSFAVIPGIRQISKTRLEDKIAMIKDTEMERISQAVELYLSD